MLSQILTIVVGSVMVSATLGAQNLQQFLAAGNNNNGGQFHSGAFSIGRNQPGRYPGSLVASGLNLQQRFNPGGLTIPKQPANFDLSGHKAKLNAQAFKHCLSVCKQDKNCHAQCNRIFPGSASVQPSVQHPSQPQNLFANLFKENPQGQQGYQNLLAQIQKRGLPQQGGVAPAGFPHLINPFAIIPQPAAPVLPAPVAGEAAEEGDDKEAAPEVIPPPASPDSEVIQTPLSTQITAKIGPAFKKLGIPAVPNRGPIGIFVGPFGFFGPKTLGLQPFRPPPTSFILPSSPSSKISDNNASSSESAKSESIEINEEDIKGDAPAVDEAGGKIPPISSNNQQTSNPGALITGLPLGIPNPFPAAFPRHNPFIANRRLPNVFQKPVAFNRFPGAIHSQFNNQFNRIAGPQPFNTASFPKSLLGGIGSRNFNANANLISNAFGKANANGGFPGLGKFPNVDGNSEDENSKYEMEDSERRTEEIEKNTIFVAPVIGGPEIEITPIEIHQIEFPSLPPDNFDTVIQAANPARRLRAPRLSIPPSTFSIPGLIEEREEPTSLGDRHFIPPVSLPLGSGIVPTSSAFLENPAKPSKPPTISAPVELKPDTRFNPGSLSQSLSLPTVRALAALSAPIVKPQTDQLLFTSSNIVQSPSLSSPTGSTPKIDAIPVAPVIGSPLIYGQFSRNPPAKKFVPLDAIPKIPVPLTPDFSQIEKISLSSGPKIPLSMIASRNTFSNPHPIRTFRHLSPIAPSASPSLPNPYINELVGASPPPRSKAMPYNPLGNPKVHQPKASLHSSDPMIVRKTYAPFDFALGTLGPAGVHRIAPSSDPNYDYGFIIENVAGPVIGHAPFGNPHSFRG